MLGGCSSICSAPGPRGWEMAPGGAKTIGLAGPAGAAVRAVLCRAVPCRAVPCRAVPCRAGEPAWEAWAVPRANGEHKPPMENME